MKFRYIAALSIIVIVINAVVFLFLNKIQIEEIYQNAKSMHTALSEKLKNVASSVEYLHLVTTKQLAQRSRVPLKYVPMVEKSSDGKYFSLDRRNKSITQMNDRVNLIGSTLALKSVTTLHEMEAALKLSDYLKLIYKNHQNFAWVYYYSKHHFTVLYPYVSAKDFQFSLNLEKLPFYQYATPQHNQNAKIFFTPLYKDAIGKGLMLTIGKPVYDGSEFLGTVALDLTLNHIDSLLKQLDNLGYKSLIFNQEDEILGSNNVITAFERSKIYDVNDFLSKKLLEEGDTFSSIKYLDGKYVYMERIYNSPIHFVYFIEGYTIWLKSFLMLLPLMLSMFLIIALLYFYRRLKVDSLILKEQSIRDHMTGAYNRRYFFDVAEKIFLKAKRKGQNIALVMTDIDDFKYVNDTYGHSAGDEAIIQMKEIFTRNLRESDLFARFGGEEFCIILDDISQEDVEKLMEKIRKEFVVNVIVKGYHKFSYTVSFGIAYGMLDTLDDMVTLADKALYKSKADGKNIVTTYTTYS